MGLLKRPVCVGIAAVAALAPVTMTMTMTGALAATAAVAAPKSGPQFATLKDSFAPRANARSGAYLSSRMSVELILAPRDESGLNNELRAAYTKGSSGYHKWLAKGQFDARYAPTKAERGAVQSYLRSAGPTVATSFFEQMALQGQSMFSGSGDSGAFECMYSGSNVENLMDSASGYAEY